MILYYSRSKKTKIFADALGEILNREVRELESDLNKKGDFGFIIKALGLTFTKKNYPISNMPNNIPEEIFVCTPIWGGQLAAPAKFFLDNADLSDTKVNVLITANIPTEKYKTDAREYLDKIKCRQGEVYIFASSDKSLPEKDVIIEQLRELLPKDGERT
jgi:flavodoxin